MGATPEVNKKQIPGSDIWYVDANGDGRFEPCAKQGCDYYEEVTPKKEHSLQLNDSKIKLALGEYQLERLAGGMLNLGFMFEHMRKLLNGDPDEQCDAATALSQYNESYLVIPLLTSVADDLSIDDRVRDAARESLEAIKGRDR